MRAECCPCSGKNSQGEKDHLAGGGGAKGNGKNDAAVEGQNIAIPMSPT